MPSNVISTDVELRRPPATRYQGSKHKLLEALCGQFSQLEFETALDAFAGTGSVAYALKSLGKLVTANDVLRSNHITSLALVENSRTTLCDAAVEKVLSPRSGRRYDDLIARNFAGIYFTDEENQQLDVLAQNISRLTDRYQRAIAYYALFQACIAKRPYNLFHRRNLYMRTADVQRSFGNKATWDTPINEHFRRHAAAANGAVFESSLCKASCGDVMDVDGDFDFVYIDPPYINGKGVGVDYRDFYHFLEGLCDYGGWEANIDRRRKHLPLTRVESPWTNPSQIESAFEELFARFADSILAVSYRSDGIPGIEGLATQLGRFKRRVTVVALRRYQYALSKNGKSQEMLLIGR